MRKKPQNFLTPVKKDKKLEHSAVPIGQPETKGGCCEEEKIINQNLHHYLNVSPKKQARQLGGQNLYIIRLAYNETKKNRNRAEVSDLYQKLLTKKIKKGKRNEFKRNIKL